MQDQNDGGLDRYPNDSGSRTVSRSDQIARDDVFAALSNSRRRHVIRAIETGERDLGDLAEEIAAHENSIDRTQLDSQQRKRVYVGLYQTHLGKLDRWGIVDWDDRGQTVAPGPNHQTALDALEAVTERESTPSLRERVAGFIRGGEA